MNYLELSEQIKKKASYLCIGLDTDIKKLPKSILASEDPVFEFNQRIIEATHQYCVAYKPNIAFYEAMGPAGWQSLAKTLEIIPKDVLVIADAKRGDIGNTSDLYARAFFETMHFDAITVAPYMGEDSIKPFLAYDGKWTIILGLTSNIGSQDFQRIADADGTPIYQHVLKKTMQWGSKENTMYVVGATQGKAFEEIRKIVPEHFLLVPGVGAQGGDLESVSKYGLNKNGGLLVNSSRGIIYASSQDDFDQVAAHEAHKIQAEMERYLETYIS